MKKLLVVISGLVLLLGLTLIIAVRFPSQEVPKTGSEIIATWYQQNRSSVNTAAAWQAHDQLHLWTKYIERALASAGLSISPLETKVVIQPGMRREQVAELLAPQFNWTTAEKRYFAKTEPQCYLNRLEGRFYPGEYYFKSYSTPDEVEAVLHYEFARRMNDFLANPDPNDPVLQSAIKVASLLQREAAGHGDERVIAGIIWNRIYADMPLQIDATLQYVKGEPGNWWPVPRPEDKFLDSPYNTYVHKGLPPTPIANTSSKMLLAALNPEPTDCFYYIHARRQFYCSDSYEGHIRNIRRYL